MNRSTIPKEPLFTPAFIRLFSFSFITFSAAFQLFPTIPFRIISLGGTKAQAGLFLAIYTYACAFAAPLTGSIADHIGRKRLLIFAASVFVIFSALYAFITSLPLLLLSACIHGVFWSALLSSSAAIMSEIVPASRRTEGFAYWGMASTAAIAIAPLAGLTIYRSGWIWLCAGMVALSIIMVILASRVHGGTSRSDAPFPKLKRIIDLRVTTVALSLFAVSFGYGGITSYVALMAVERHLEPRSLFFTIFALTIMVARLLTAPVGDRMGPKALLYPSLILVPIGLAILAITTTYWQLILGAIIYGAGFGGAYPAFVTWVLGRTDPARRAATFGSILWAFDTGIGTGSLATGIIVQHAGFTKAFAAMAIVSALAIPVFRLTSPLLREAPTEK